MDFKPNSIYVTLTCKGGTGSVRLGPTTVVAGLVDGFEDSDKDLLEWNGKKGKIEQAMVRQTDHTGTVVSWRLLDGDEWREIQDQGEVNYISFWVRRGVSLHDAIAACIEGCDPDGYHGESEQSAENVELDLAALEHAVYACLPDLKHYASMHGPGPDRRLADLQKVLSAIKGDA
jgi:hypothetical protein